MKEDKDMVERFTGWLKARLPVIRGNRDSFAIGIVAVAEIVAVMLALQVIAPVGLDFLLSVAMVLTTFYMVTKD